MVESVKDLFYSIICYLEKDIKEECIRKWQDGVFRATWNKNLSSFLKIKLKALNIWRETTQESTPDSKQLLGNAH